MPWTPAGTRRSEHPLPQLQIARTESAGARQQVIPPHAVEARAQPVGECRPRGLEVRVPGHQRAVVVGAEVVQVFDHEALCAGEPDVGEGGELAVGEDVAVDPRIGAVPGLAASDGVQQEQSIVGQAALGHVHVGRVVLAAHVLEHAEAHDTVEAAVEIAVVGEPDLDRQAGAPRAHEVGLLCRDGGAGALHAVALGREPHEASPSAADVQHAHAWLESELAADPVQPVFLRFVQGGAALPEAAGVGHARIEHRGIEIVAQVVVCVPDLPRAPHRLPVEQPRPQMMQHGRPAAHCAVQPRAQQPVEQLVKAGAVPMAVHVGFAEPETAEREHAGRHAWIVQPDVPRARAVEAHIGLGQQWLDMAPRAVIPARPLQRRQTFASAHGRCIRDGVSDGCCRDGDYQRRTRTRTGTGRGCTGIVPCLRSHVASRNASETATTRTVARAFDCGVGGFLLGRCIAVSCGMPSTDGRADGC